MSSIKILSKKTRDNGETFNRLNSYFNALENNTLDEYHDYRKKQNQYKKKQRQEQKTL